MTDGEQTRGMPAWSVTLENANGEEYDYPWCLDVFAHTGQIHLLFQHKDELKVATFIASNVTRIEMPPELYLAGSTNTMGDTIRKWNAGGLLAEEDSE